MRARAPVPSDYISMIERDIDVLPDAIRCALQSVPRHRYLDGWFRLEVKGLQAVYRHIDFDRNDPTEQMLADVYTDQALVTAHDGVFATSSTTQPSLVVRMLIALDIHPGMRVLEIGTGTGYNAALLAELCQEPSHVFTIEYQRDVADKARRFLREEGYGDVHVIHGDGFAGVKDAGPFDRIIATVGCSDVSPHWIEQLSPSGVLLVPLQHGLSDPLVRLAHDRAHSAHVLGRIVGRAGFMKIQGDLRWKNPWQTLGKHAFPGSPVWQRPIPGPLTLSNSAMHPFGAPNHWGFRFYLALRSQNLWYDSTGYGLATAEGECIVKFTPTGLEAYAASPCPGSIDKLYTSLLSVIEEWNAFGCPDPTDYEIRLLPPVSCEHPVEDPEREWRIKRPHHVEAIRLP